MKTIQKVYVDEIHYRRVFDQARPPLDRLVEMDVLSDAQIERLLSLRNQIDILKLRESLENNINKLWQIKPRNDTIPVNIFDTLRKEEDKT